MAVAVGPSTGFFSGRYRAQSKYSQNFDLYHNALLAARPVLASNEPACPALPCVPKEVPCHGWLSNISLPKSFCGHHT
jgi:hypothetical protein